MTLGVLLFYGQQPLLASLTAGQEGHLPGAALDPPCEGHPRSPRSHTPHCGAGGAPQLEVREEKPSAEANPLQGFVCHPLGRKGFWQG